MNHYDHETDFRAHNENDQLVDVHITFNIEQDDIEVLEFSRFVFKKCYGIEMGHITARFVGNGEEYTPSADDLREWKRDIQLALQKEFSKQTA